MLEHVRIVFSLFAGIVLSAAPLFSAEEMTSRLVVTRGTEPPIQDSQEPSAMTAQSVLPFLLWSRQSYETKKSEELASLVERLLGAGKVGVHVQYEWPTWNESGAMTDLQPKRVNALIVVDSGADIAFVENLASRVLGVVPERGDKVNVYAVASKTGLRELFLSPQAVLDLIKFFIVVLLGLIILVTLSRSANQISSSLERAATVPRTHDIDVTLSPKVSPGVGMGSPRSRLGSFSPSAGELTGSPSAAFSQADPELLAKVLEQENSRSIAIFISTLESEIAGKVLSSLPPSKQEEVALTLPQMVEPDPREVAQLQAQIHLKLRKLALEKK